MYDNVLNDREQVASIVRDTIASELPGLLSTTVQQAVREALSPEQRQLRARHELRLELQRMRETSEQNARDLAEAVAIARRTLLQQRPVTPALGDRPSLAAALDALDRLAPPSTFRR